MTISALPLAQEEIIDIVLYLPSVAALIVEPFLEPDNEDEIDLISLSSAQVRELYAAGAYFRDDTGDCRCLELRRHECAGDA